MRNCCDAQNFGDPFAMSAKESTVTEAMTDACTNASSKRRGVFAHSSVIPHDAVVDFAFVYNYVTKQPLTHVSAYHVHTTADGELMVSYNLHRVLWK